MVVHSLGSVCEFDSHVSTNPLNYLFMYLLEDRGYGIRYIVFEGEVEECQAESAILEADPANINGDGHPFTYSTILDIPEDL